MKSTRREFLKQSAVAGAAASVPYIWTSQSARARDLNSKPTIAAIGVGGSRGRYNQGGHIARRAAQFGQMIAVCDVDDLHNQEFNKDFDGKLKTYQDYRKLLENEKPDIVTIGTPDHWHVPIAIAAMRAGADVYCEKPLTLTIDEGIEICKVVKETGKVFQVGTQQRSQDELRFLKAIALVQSGRLGNDVKTFVAIGGGPSGGPFKTGDAPEGLDWDLWVGPAQEADYSEERRRDFRWWYDYSGGQVTDWGAHHIDIAQWALGVDNSGPTKVSGGGKYPPVVPDNFNWQAYFDGQAALPQAFHTPTSFTFELTYPNGRVIHFTNHYNRDDRTNFGNGILFEGEKGRIFVNRGKLEGKPVEELSQQDQEDIMRRVRELYKGKEPGDHMRNFFQCLEDRTQPISDVYTHHRTMTTCHLCNISMMLGRDLEWDPEQQAFKGDDQAEALRSRKQREGYSI